MRQPWVDSQATWTLRQTGATWATAGMGSGTDYAAAATASVALPASAGQWVSLDVTAAVQEWVNGAANYGFVLRQQAAGGFVSAKFCTELATYPCNTGNWRPTLTITYHLGGSGAPPRPERASALTAPNAPTAAVSITKYYHFGGQRVAMRQAGVLYYLFGDHLGSTSLVTDEYGVVQWRTAYTPYGETRASAGSPPTDRRFTGQRAERGLGSLYDYQARRYSPRLGRFISPDTIVPDPADPQSLNRYAYTRNSPVTSAYCTFSDQKLAGCRLGAGYTSARRDCATAGR